MQPQIILITGASSGFGKITAQMLSEQGHIVYGTSRKPSENIGKVRMLVVDVTNSISVRQAVEQIISEQGRMDVLINNAGMFYFGEVLDQKSQRLKQLTNDLVEASRASSGNVALNMEKMDLREFLMQTSGEFEEKFAARGLHLMTNCPPHPLFIMADGRRLWRIIENLYRNVEKYAMPNTRVYLNVVTDGSSVAVSMKNISEQPLNISAEELTERFTRGDESRTTEGSGLGLSIAKDLTELQGGKFEIYLDGDLFKVTITFPCVDVTEK